MAKRRKGSRARAADREAKGKGDTFSEGEPREADPLLMPPWPTANCQAQEVEERRRFERVWQDFRRGDHHRCRAEAAVLADQATSEEVRLRALALLGRLEVDPLALAVAAGALLLLLVILVVTFG